MGRGERPHDRVLTDLIRRLGEDLPDEVAIQEVTGRSLTWGELADQALRWASAYKRAGVTQGENVLTMVPNSVEAYFAWLGLGWLRAVEVPVNTMYLGRMLRYVVSNSEARVLVVATRFLERFADIADALAGVETIVVPDGDGPFPALPCTVVGSTSFLDGVEPDREITGPGAHDLAAMIYTSGTTGPSKGVLVPWATLSEFSNGLAPGMLPRGGHYYSVYPAFHVSGKNALFTVAKHAGRLVLRDTFSAHAYWDDVREFGCTTAGLVAPMANVLLAAPPNDNDADHPLRHVAIGPLIPRLEEFQRRFGVRVATAYGMTEIGMPIVSGWDPPNTRTCGRTKAGFPGYEVRVVDEFDEPVGPNEVGELVVRSDAPWAVCAGYYRMPEQTAAAWRNGWFHTGDGFMIDEDGWFYFVDRLKDAIRRRGENVSSFEVEAHVNEHPAVQESAAIAVPSELGEDDIKVVVVLRPEVSLTADELIAFLAESMPRFMIPRYVEFVDALPKTDATLRTRKVQLRENPLNGATWDRERAGVVVTKE
jgi:crotonobetaine/carnitine-CoA ligase